MKRRFLLLSVFLIVVMSLSAQDPLNLIPPSNLQGENPPMTDYAHLTWEEPVDSVTWTTPAGLLGYNIYRDSEIVGSIDVPALEYFDLNLEMLTYVYHISAVYDLTSYGFPGETGESALEGPVEVTLCCLPELPFIENFTTGMFETNQWTAEGNWRIAGQLGNPAPSAEFDTGPLITNYSNSMTSYWISGTGFIDGDIFLDFDLKLNTTNQSGTEFLYVDVYNGEEWTNKATYDNSQVYDWIRPHLDLTAEAKGEQFKIRFRAEGENSANIESWEVDNIEVFKVCAVPIDLVTSYPSGHDYCEILLEWIAPDTTGYGTSTWLEWDTGENTDAIGLTDGGTFLVASRYTPAQLAQYSGTNLTKIRLFPYTDGGTIVLKVWTGVNASQLMVSQPIASYVAGQWNEFTLTTPVPVSGTTELWFGYSITHAPGIKIAGVDAGPAVAGYGDMYSIDGSVWESMAQAYELDYNWNLAGLVEPPAKTKSLDHYNIYRNDEFIISTNELSYIDTVYVGYSAYCYNVTAVYVDCESDLSNTACFFIYGPCPVGIDDIDLNEAAIHPNPASSMITVSCNALTEVIIYDILGNILKDIKVSPHDTDIAVDVRSLTNGVYLVKLISSDGDRCVRKMVVKH